MYIVVVVRIHLAVRDAGKNVADAVQGMNHRILAEHRVVFCPAEIIQFDKGLVPYGLFRAVHILVEVGVKQGTRDGEDQYNA